MVNPASLAGPVVGAVGPFLESGVEVGRVQSAEADGEFGALLQGLVPAALATATSPAIAVAKGSPSTSTAPATPDIPANFRDAFVANANVPEAATSVVNEKIIMPSDLVRDSMPAVSKEIVDRRMVEPRTEQRRESLRGAGEEPFTAGMIVPGSLQLPPSRTSPLAAATPADPPTRRFAAQATSAARGAIAEEVASPPPATETFDRRAGEFKLSEPRVGEPRMAEPRLGAGLELPRTRSEGPAVGTGVAPAATAVTVASATLADTPLRVAASLPSEPARRPAAGDLPRAPAAADIRAAEIFAPRVGELPLAEPRMGDLKLAEPQIGARLELPLPRSEGPAIGTGVAPAATAVTVATATLADTPLRAAAESLPSEPAWQPAAGELPKSPAAADTRAAEIFEPRVGEPRVGEPRMGDLKLAEPRVGEPRMAEPRLGAGLELPRTRSEGPAVGTGVAPAATAVTVATATLADTPLRVAASLPSEPARRPAAGDLPRAPAAADMRAAEIFAPRVGEPKLAEPRADEPRIGVRLELPRTRSEGPAVGPGAAPAATAATVASATLADTPLRAAEIFEPRMGDLKLAEPRVGEPRMAEPRLGAGLELPRTRSEGPAVGMGVAPTATAVTVAAATLADTPLRAAASLPSEPARRPAAGDLPRAPAAADMRAAEIFEPRVGEPKLAEPRMGEPRMAEPRLGAGLELPRTRSEGPAIRGAAILAQPTQIASDSRPLTAAVDPGRVPPREPAPAVFEALRYESLRRPAGSKEAATRSMNVGAASLAAANAAATASANVAASQPGLMPVAAPSIMAPPAPQVAEPLQRNEIDLESDTWKENLTELVVNLVAAEDTETVVKLSPEHLGDLEVGVSIRNGEANVSFASGIAETRVALEQALPRLRELMGQAGLELAHAGVHSSLAGGSERRQEFSTGAAPAVVPRNEVEAADESAARTAEPGDERPGGIDLYA